MIGPTSNNQEPCKVTYFKVTISQTAKNSYPIYDFVHGVVQKVGLLETSSFWPPLSPYTCLFVLHVLPSLNIHSFLWVTHPPPSQKKFHDT